VRVQRPDLAYLALIAGGFILLIGLSFLNYRYVVTPAIFRDQFSPRWLATRLLLTAQIDPYSVEATRTIQQQMSGRFSVPGEDQYLFLYPFYSMALYVPFALIGDNLVARAIWMTFLEVAMLGLAFLSMNLVRWKPPWPVTASFLAFAFIWYHGARALLTSNLAVVAALAIGLCLWGIARDQDLLAGVALGLASMKPQMVVLLIPLVIIWSVSRRRWLLAASATATTLVLFAGSMYFSPDWYIHNLQQIREYQSYAPPGTIPAILAAQLDLFGRVFGWLITAICCVVLLREWFLVLGKDVDWFLWVAALTLVVTNIIGVRTATENYVALLPAITLIFATWERRITSMGSILIVITMVIMAFGFWALFYISNPADQLLSERLIMYIPLPLLLFFMLYWIRWWVTQLHRLPTGNLQAIRRL